MQLFHVDFSLPAIARCFLNKSMTFTKEYTSVTNSFAKGKSHVPLFCECC